MNNTLTHSLSNAHFDSEFSLPSKFYEKMHLIELYTEADEICTESIKKLIEYYAVGNSP